MSPGCMNPNSREPKGKYSPYWSYGYVFTNYEQMKDTTSDIKSASPKATQDQLF